MTLMSSGKEQTFNYILGTSAFGRKRPTRGRLKHLRFQFVPQSPRRRPPRFQGSELYSPI